MYLGDLSLDTTHSNIFIFSILCLLVLGIGLIFKFWLSRIFARKIDGFIIGACLFLVLAFWASIYVYNAENALHFGMHDEVWFALKHCLGIGLAYIAFRLVRKYA